MCYGGINLTAMATKMERSNNHTHTYQHLVFSQTHPTPLSVRTARRFSTWFATTSALTLYYSKPQVFTCHSHLKRRALPLVLEKPELEKKVEEKKPIMFSITLKNNCRHTHTNANGTFAFEWRTCVCVWKWMRWRRRRCCGSGSGRNKENT